jgi:hypothetical protein
VKTFPGLVGTADGEVVLADGILAAQSTPLTRISHSWTCARAPELA